MVEKLLKGSVQPTELCWCLRDSAFLSCPVSAADSSCSVSQLLVYKFFCISLQRELHSFSQCSPCPGLMRGGGIWRGIDSQPLLARAHRGKGANRQYDTRAVLSPRHVIGCHGRRGPSGLSWGPSTQEMTLSKSLEVRRSPHCRSPGRVSQEAGATGQRPEP